MYSYDQALELANKFAELKLVNQITIDRIGDTSHWVIVTTKKLQKFVFDLSDASIDVEKEIFTIAATFVNMSDSEAVIYVDIDCAHGRGQVWYNVWIGDQRIAKCRHSISSNVLEVIFGY